MKRSFYLRQAYNYYSYFNNLTCKCLDLLPQVFRSLLYKLMLGHFGKSSSIDYGFKFRYGKRITIGDNVTISSSCEIYPGYFIKNSRVEIGNDVTVGPGVMFIGAGHEPGTMKDVGGPITVKSGAYIGARCTIRYGVTIGENSVIAAGSIVTRSVPKNTIFIQKRPSD